MTNRRPLTPREESDVHDDRGWSFRRPLAERDGYLPAWLASFLLVIAIASAARAQEDDSPRRDRAKTEAVVLWTGLAIVSILIVGIGLIWGVTRAAKRILKKHEPVHTEMPNIWYLNPPEKRKQDEP